MNRALVKRTGDGQVSLHKVREDVNQFLEDFYSSNQVHASAIHPSYGRLWSTMLQNHKAGGKRLRPFVMLLAYIGLGGSDYKEALPIAAALELLHTCLLAHDDIIDRDYIRHGQPNIAGQYQNIYKKGELNSTHITHYANSAALLAGDLLLADSHRLIATSSFSEVQKCKLLELLNEALFIVAAGELLDTEAAFLLADRAESLLVANLKTAHYSFVTAFKMGATLANARPEVLQALTSIGHAMGIAYQIADDLLGMYGSEAITGKSTSSDLAEGKHTYLIELGLQLADSTGTKLINRTLGNPAASASDIIATRQLLIDCGAKAATEELMNKEYSRAVELIEDSSLNYAAIHSLKQLLTQLIGREA